MQVYETKGVVFGPGKAANAGGVAVSGDLTAPALVPHEGPVNMDDTFISLSYNVIHATALH